MATTCEIGSDILEAFKKFQLAKAKNHSALILKIDMKNLKLVVDEHIEDDANIADIAEDLPESVPRIILFSLRSEKGGRLQYPIIMLYYIPREIQPRLGMAYSSTKSDLGTKISVNKSIECQDSELLTEEWLLNHI